MEERYSEAGRGYEPRPAMTPHAAHGARDVPTVRSGTQPAAGFAPTPRGDLYRNFGDGYTRAFELALTPALFGGLGYALDNWLGLVPLFTIVFALVAVVTLLARTWSGYVQRMEILEKAGPWANPGT